ncbi:MAG: hypothetical protein MI747_04780, partial [Desulfobacterales bacterium]|nr:hypothetical protein [Desulfobacterales bacterium]
MRDNLILTVSQLNEYLTNLTGSLEFMEHPGIIELQEAIQAYEALRLSNTREEYVAAERVRLAAHHAEILDINLLGAIDLQVYNVQGEILTALGDTVSSDNIMTLPALDAALRAEIPMGLAPGGAGRNSLNT